MYQQLRKNGLKILSSNTVVINLITKTNNPTIVAYLQIQQLSEIYYQNG